MQRTLNFSLFLYLSLFSLHGAAGVRGIDQAGDVDVLDADYSTEFNFSNEGLREQNTYSEYDETTGRTRNDLSTNDDQHRLSLQFHLNGDVKQATAISGIEGNYGQKLVTGTWWELLLSSMQMNFSEISVPHDGISPNSLDLLTSKERMFTLGTGIAHRSVLIQYFIDSQRFFDTAAAYATYNSLTENLTGKSYRGFGLRADYGIHRRLSSRFHVGGKMSYSLMSLKRPQNFDNESSDARSMTVQWIGLVLDLTLYY